MSKKTILKIAFSAIGLVAVAAVVFAFFPRSGASAAPATFKPKFAMTTDYPLDAGVSPTTAGVATIPFWKSSFTSGGVTYPFQMVGTDPRAGSATTVVPVNLVPIKFVFSNGAVLDGTSKVRRTEDSPIFHPYQFTDNGTNVGYTQYNDAIQRAEFWNYVSTVSPNYHVKLGQPTVWPTITINVPHNWGEEVVTTTNVRLGLIDAGGVGKQLNALIDQYHYDPTQFLLFGTYNIVLYIGYQNYNNCCIIGYHTARHVKTSTGGKGILTYAFASYVDPGIFTASGIQDIHPLSHEMAEWMNDPFVDNPAPNWYSPIAPQYGCSNILEVGDPLVGVAINVGVWHPQDEAFFSWFARQSPSLGVNGQYTYLGTFSTYSPSC